MKTLPYLFIDEFFTERKNPAVINTNPSNAMRFRSKIVMTAAFSLLFTAVAANFFKISVLDNKKYQTMANDQHFGSISISAHRGSIYDANGYTFAKSATVYKIFIDPQSFQEDMKNLGKLIEKRNADKANGTYTPVYDEEGNETNVLPASTDEFREQAATFLASKLSVTADKVKEAMDAEGRYVEFKTQIEKPVADEIAEFFGDVGFVSVGSVEDTKRYYPQNELAAQVVGFTNGNIAYGIESYYDSYLSGVDGRTVSAVDSNGKELPYRYSKTFEPKDGSDVYLTIDRELQFILEKHLQEMSVEHEVKNRSCAILMNPQTGAVLSMATYPSFDLNDPMKLADDGMLLRKIFTEKKIDNPTEKDIEEYTPEARERQWKNKCISETYEPGSVFKIVTAASAIEEKTIDVNKFSYNCEGFVTRDDGTDVPLTIKCHETNGHHVQDFKTALKNSCNPAFISIGESLGIEKFHQYFDAFGFEEKSGIDLPYEVKGKIPPLKDTPEERAMTNIDLTLSSFGQCVTVTPLELITACSAVVNGGYLLEPYVVDRVVDSDGNIELKNERTVRRQVISEDTSAIMRESLEYVVENNQTGNVKIKGYAIGGKSGTSQRLSEMENTLDENKQENADIQEYGASYICFTPADHPDLMLLVLADMPLADSTGQYYGSKCAVPCAAKILEEVLEYMDKSPEYSELELKNLDIKIPLVRGSSIDDAKKTLLGLGIMEDHIVTVGSGIEVVEQSPKTGMSISKDGYVYLYTEKGNTTDPVTVPDLTGYSPEAVNQTIYAYGLNYVSKNIVGDQEDAYVESQSIEGGLMVEKGTTIEVKFKAQQFND